jgi:hypothetical protein
MVRTFLQVKWSHLPKNRNLRFLVSATTIKGHHHLVRGLEDADVLPDAFLQILTHKKNKKMFFKTKCDTKNFLFFKNKISALAHRRGSEKN